jgi:hypothetical protein
LETCDEILSIICDLGNTAFVMTARDVPAHLHSSTLRRDRRQSAAALGLGPALGRTSFGTSNHLFRNCRVLCRKHHHLDRKETPTAGMPTRRGKCSTHRVLFHCDPTSRRPIKSSQQGDPRYRGTRAFPLLYRTMQNQRSHAIAICAHMMMAACFDLQL